MATPVLMPKQGNTVEECILVSWKKKKGDTVKTGEIVADIETDKATFEIEAPADGEILETFFTEGTLVPVLTNIAVIGKAGEDVSSFKPVKVVKAPVESKAATPAASAAAPSAPTAKSSSRQVAVAAP
ncbi:MAG: 2-oxo acid dehydrogenase subunit E2, partial [Spirochaetia bacterium]|nr:2-oxo acid dehydrogenase subunit E2 [Spirochaetia bacterium]